jgi:hypothetical protein
MGIRLCFSFRGEAYIKIIKSSVLRGIFTTTREKKTGGRKNSIMTNLTVGNNYIILLSRVRGSVTNNNAFWTDDWIY